MPLLKCLFQQQTKIARKTEGQTHVFPLANQSFVRLNNPIKQSCQFILYSVRLNLSRTRMSGNNVIMLNQTKSGKLTIHFFHTIKRISFN